MPILPVTCFILHTATFGYTSMHHQDASRNKIGSHWYLHQEQSGTFTIT